VGIDSSVYIPSGRRIIRLNHTNGTPMDSSEELATTNSINPRITVGSDGKLYVSNGASNPADGKFYSFSQSLQTLWSVSAPYNYYSGPALGSNGILVVNNTGTSIWAYKTQIGITNNGGKIPSAFKLYQNYPNPFNPATTIKFDILKSAYTKLTIYDILGKEVAKLVDEEMEPDSYEITWDGSNFASGTYIYEIESGDFKDIKKLILVK
jgi:hypothetical protein